MKIRSLKALGTSLTETIVAAGCTVLLIGVAIPAFQSAADAGDQGAAHVLVDSETRHTLFRMAREMENASTTAVDGAGNPRLTITAGLEPEPLVFAIVNGKSEMGGFFGTLGTEVNHGNTNHVANFHAVVTGQGHSHGNGGGHAGQGSANEGGSHGSGAHGRSKNGRVRGNSDVGTAGVGDSSNRPRHANIPNNSILTFQKVSGYAVDVDGSPIVTWSTPITYEVVNRRLMRTQDGRSSVVCPVCTGFQAQITDIGTVVLTIVSQAKMHAKPGLAAVANQIEISPKN